MIDWSDCPAVESVPEKLGGAWVLKATRFPLRALFENVDAGATLKDVADWFDVDEAQLHAVMAYLSTGAGLPEHAIAQAA